MTSRLTEAAALARCDELGLQGRVRECYALHLLLHGSDNRPKGYAQRLAMVLQVPPSAIYAAIKRADRAVREHEERQADCRAREPYA